MKKEENNVVENEEVNQEEAKKDTKENNTIEKLKAQLKEEKEKSDEYYEHLKRNMAEFDNFKKRISKEKDMMYNTISASVISELLPILDNFEKALNSESTDESYKNGMAMIYGQLIDALNKIGVEEIEALNTTFDPNFHEAVMHVEDENFGENTVSQEFQKGYMYKESVVRHSMVKVSN